MKRWMELDIFNTLKKKKKVLETSSDVALLSLRVTYPYPKGNISTHLSGAYLRMQTGPLLGLTLVDQLHHLVAKTSTPNACEL